MVARLREGSDTQIVPLVSGEDLGRMVAREASLRLRDLQHAVSITQPAAPVAVSKRYSGVQDKSVLPLNC